MKKIDLGQTLGILANLGVIAGIVFLAVELRQNTESLDESRRLAAANAYQARAFTFASQTLSNVHSPEMVEALVAFQAASEADNPAVAFVALSPQDQLRIRSYYLARIAISDNNYYQYREGYLDEERYGSIDSTIIKRESPIWNEIGISLQTPAMEEEINRLQEQ